MKAPQHAEEIAAFDPHWCLLWGQGVTGFHLDIWLPYLRRSRYRYGILSGSDTASAETRRKIEALPNCAFLEPFEEVLTVLETGRSFNGFLYIGNRERNFAVMNRFGRHLHVWLGHGESDKVYNARRTAALYDSMFVAGHDVVARYPRSIRRWVAAGASAIGTPIVDGIDKDRWTAPRPVRRVLYAPTWEGHSRATDYSSVPDVVPRLISAMPSLQERGIELLVRPHPTTGSRIPGYRELLEQLFDAGARRGGAKAEDFMWSDVMVSDISGVTAEYLFTEKPIILPATERIAAIGKDQDRLRAAYPYAYLWEPEAVSLAEQLAGLEAADPKREARATAATLMFDGHETLDEAVRTFDTALSTVRRRTIPGAVRGPITTALRWGFAARRRARPTRGAIRRRIRGPRRAAPPG